MTSFPTRPAAGPSVGTVTTATASWDVWNRPVTINAGEAQGELSHAFGRGIAELSYESTQTAPLTMEGNPYTLEVDLYDSTTRYI